jgi:cell wall integrity and stress response component
MVLPLILAWSMALVHPAVAQNYDYVGCYSSAGDLVNIGSYTWQSNSWCYGQCATKGKVVFATHDGNYCYCGDVMPSSGQVDDSSCNSNCTGYPQELCGGANFWSFYSDVDNIKSSILAAYSSTAVPSSSSTASSTSTSSTTSASSSSTSSASSSRNSPSSSSDHKPSATNTSQGKSGGISSGAIAGIVLGIVAALGLIGGTLVFLKKRRNNYDYSPSSTPNGFKEPFGVRPPDPVYSPQPSGGSGYAVDQRLNPVMLGERRISVGSLADARDYSRTILRVANPDDA